MLLMQGFRWLKYSLGCPDTDCVHNLIFCGSEDRRAPARADGAAVLHNAHQDMETRQELANLILLDNVEESSEACTTGSPEGGAGPNHDPHAVLAREAGAC